MLLKTHHKSIILSLLCAIASLSASAQLVVTDPAALARLVETINQGQKMIQTIEKQISTAEKTSNALHGNLRRAENLKSSLANYRNILNQVQRSIPEIDPEYLPSGHIPQMTQAGDVRNVLDFIYNPSQLRGDLSRNMQTIHKEATTRAALEASELSVASADKNFAELLSLASEIDSTENLKDAADMSNKLLLKILAALEELTNLQAQLTRMEAAKNYKGIRAKRKLKPQTITAGEKLELEITNGSQMYKTSKCSRGLQEAGLCG